MNLILPFYLLCCAIFFAVISLVLPPTGLLRGPWTLESMTRLKNTEHFIYWLCVIGIPLLTVVLNSIFSRASDPYDEKEFRSARPRAWKIVLIAISFLVGYLLVPRGTINGPIEVMDEGHMVEAARKSDQGKKWYQDIFFIYGPGLEVVQTKAAFHLFGDSVAGARKFRWFAWPIAFLAALAIAWLVSARAGPVALFFLVGVSDLYFHARMAFPLLSFFCVLIALREKDTLRARIWLGSAGGLCFVSYFYSMESGPMIGLALTIGLLLTSWKKVLTLWAGAAIVAAPFLLWAIIAGRLSFIWENFTMMKMIMTAAQGKPTPVLYETVVNFLMNPLRLFLPSGAWVRWWFPPFVMGALLAWALDRRRRGDVSIRNTEALFVAVAGLVFFYVALGRSDFDHWRKGTSFYWLALLIALDRFWELARESLAPMLARAGALAAVVFLSGIFLVHARLPFVAPFVTPADGPMPAALEKIGDLRVEPNEQAHLAGTVERIWKFANKGDDVFIFTVEPMYYYLAQVNNPTRFPHIIKIVTPEAVQEVVDNLKLKRPLLVVAMESEGKINCPYYQEPIADYVRANYEPRDRFDGYVFLVRK